MLTWAKSKKPLHVDACEAKFKTCNQLELKNKTMNLLKKITYQ